MTSGSFICLALDEKNSCKVQCVEFAENVQNNYSTISYGYTDLRRQGGVRHHQHGLGFRGSSSTSEEAGMRLMT